MKSDIQTEPKQLATALRADGCWELSADVVAYPVVQDGRDGKMYKLGVYLERYEARELKAAFEAEKQGYTQDTDGDLIQIARTYREYFPMLDKHFVKFDGLSNTDPEKQKRFLDSNYQLKSVIIKETWGGVKLYRESDFADNLLDIDAVDDPPIQVPTIQRLWNGVQDVTVKMAHHLTKPNLNQYNRFNSAIKQKIGRRGLLSAEVNNDVLEILYGEAAVQADGFTINGQPCVQKNKAEWVPLMPLWHKVLVATELYRETKLKN